jgi:hypothetical protein
MVSGASNHPKTYEASQIDEDFVLERRHIGQGAAESSCLDQEAIR